MNTGTHSDLTRSFEDTGHSQDARKDLENYLIGTLKVSEHSAKSNESGATEESNCLVM
jgi:hypothetical protein